MLAIIEDLNSQYRVKEGDTIDVDIRDVELGSSIDFDKVCLVDSEAGAKIGAPYVEGAKVSGTVLEAFKGPKLITTHFRRRKDSKTRQGHRQKHLRVRIDKIEA
jgi:large subunit ribosomal protein L21